MFIYLITKIKRFNIDVSNYINNPIIINEPVQYIKNIQNFYFFNLIIFTLSIIVII